MNPKMLQSSQSFSSTRSFLQLNKKTWLKGLDVDAIARKYSTPLYITNQTRLLDNLKAFINLLGDARNIYFPVKTSPCLAMFKILAEQGCGADCASAREIQLARLAGIDDIRLSYYSPAPDISLAVELLTNGGNVIMDSPSKLAELETHLGETMFAGTLFLRINPSLDNGYRDEADYQKHTSHGNLTSQFGLPSEDLLPLLKVTTLPVSGLHVHVGTQMDNVAIFQECISALHDLCDQIHAETEHTIEVLNLGGGLGIASNEDEYFPSIAELAKALQPKFRPGFTYKMEPGNALFGNATALLTKVVTRKTTRGKGWAIIDVGSDQLFKVTLAGFKQTVLRRDGRPLPTTGVDSIAGPLCFAGDVILPETDLTGVEEGDLLLLPNAGAYCRAISNRFNGHSEPGTLIVEDSQSIESNAREATIQEMQQREVGLAYTHEDPYWEPTIQSFRPHYLDIAVDSAKVLDRDHVDKLRSEYLHKQCGNDTYTFHDFTQVKPGRYEMMVAVDSPVSFISAPLVTRIVSDAAVAASIDFLGYEEKNISVWGQRFNLSLNGILRSNRRQRLQLHLTPSMSATDSKKQEFIGYWQLGENGSSYGNILIVV